MLPRGRSRQVSLKSVGFLGPDSERWTLLPNALQFHTEQEQGQLGRSEQLVTAHQAQGVRFANRRPFDPDSYYSWMLGSHG